MLSRRHLLATSAAFMACNMTAFAQASAASENSIPADVLELLDLDEMTAVLLRTVEVGSSTYYVIGLSSTALDIGEPVVVRRSQSQELAVLKDFIGVPQAVSTALYAPDDAGLNLQAFALDPTDAIADLVPGLAIQQATEAQDNKVFDSAYSNVGKLRSSDAPGTGGGVYACAWAVNRIVSIALRRPIANTLSTSVLGSVPAARNVAISIPVKGCIMISPTVDRHVAGRKRPIHVVGHVGIVGDGDLIYSNSSAHGVWMQNWNLDRWNKPYRNKNLDILFIDSMTYTSQKLGEALANDIKQCGIRPGSPSTGHNFRG